MGLRYKNDELSILGLKTKFLDEDFEFMLFKSTLLLNNNDEFFNNLVNLLVDDKQIVKKNAMKSIYFLLCNTIDGANDEINNMVKKLIKDYDIQLNFDELSV